MSAIQMALVPNHFLDSNIFFKEESQIFFFLKSSGRQKSSFPPDDYYLWLIILTEKNVWFFSNLISYSFRLQSSALVTSFPTRPRSPLVPTEGSRKEIHSLINSPLYLSDKLNRSCTFSCLLWDSFYPSITLSSRSLITVP